MGILNGGKIMNQPKETVVYHIHHSDSESYKREVSINGSVFSVCLSTDAPDETIEYLTNKATEILKGLKEEAK